MDPTLLMQMMPYFSSMFGGGQKGQSQGGFGSQSAGTLGLGVLQTVPSLINLIRLGREERPNYQIAPEQQKAYNLAEQRSKFGFMPQQIGAFNQNLSQAQNTDYYNARNMAGGGLAQALFGRLSSQRLGALNQFAAQDAQENRQSVRDLFGETRGITSQQNLGKSEDIRNYYGRMEAAGRGLSSGLTNTASGINANQALGLGFGNQGLAAGVGGGSGGGMPNYSGPPSINQPPYGGAFGPQNNPYGPENMGLNNQTGYPRQPFGGGLFNPYNYMMPPPTSPYKQPSMLSTGG